MEQVFQLLECSHARIYACTCVGMDLWEGPPTLGWVKIDGFRGSEEGEMKGTGYIQDYGCMGL